MEPQQAASIRNAAGAVKAGNTIEQAATEWGVRPDEVRKYLSPDGGDLWLESHLEAQRQRREEGPASKH
jgi:hypothetical protein